VDVLEETNITYEYRKPTIFPRLLCLYAIHYTYIIRTNKMHAFYIKVLI